jgi:hypothetical protein
LSRKKTNGAGRDIVAVEISADELNSCGSELDIENEQSKKRTIILSENENL